MSFFAHIDLFSTIFLLQKINFPIFAPANPRENGLARESAFFALCLKGELAHSQHEKENEGKDCFRCYVCISLYIHKRRSMT